MAHRRFTIDLAIPEDTDGKLPAALNAKPTPEQLTALGNMTWREIFIQMVRRLQLQAVKINAGTSKEENTVRIKHHLCRHAEGLPCDPEEDI